MASVRRFGLVLLFSVCALLTLVFYHQKAFVKTRVDETPIPYFRNNVNVRQLNVNFRGNKEIVEALQSGQANSRSLASADLNGDAAPDLVAGYEYNGIGILTTQAGNTDAFAPQDDSVFERLQNAYNPDSMLPTAKTIQVAEPVDFLQIGDFNQDNYPDLLFAARGGNLFLLAGDGQGRFGEAEKISLPGTVTALTSGEFRAADGKADIAVGISDGAGSRVLIFDGAENLFNSEPSVFALPTEILAVEFGELDSDSFMDLAALTYGEIVLIHGWGRKTSPETQSRMEIVKTTSNICKIALGHFIWDREGRKEIAGLATDGTVSIFQGDGLDTRPFTEQELLKRNRGQFRPEIIRNADIEAVQGWNAGKFSGWKTARTVITNSVAGDPYRQTILTKTNMASRENDDILVSGGNGLNVVRQLDPQSVAEGLTQSNMIISDGDMAEINLDSMDSATAVLQLPQKLNGERNLIVLQEQGAPQIVALVPTSITVDRTDDPSGGGLTAASVCGAGPSDCSLRGAVQFANIAANSPTTINLPAGTYTLSTNGTSAGGCDGNTVGDLGLNLSTTIVGAGAATTIIRQTGNGPASDGDRVMCMNEGFLLNLTYGFSAVTMVGGRDGTSGGTGTALGGGGIIGGEKDNSLTLTSVTLANNQVTVLGSANIGGGGIQITGGNLTITNSMIGGTGAPGTYADRTSTNTANLQAGSGGGVMFTPSAPAHTAGTGTLIVTGTSFSRNTAGSIGSGGGGADLVTFAFAAPGGIGSGSADISTSTFSNNQSLPGNGGGILVESLATTVATTSITNNAAGNRGGAIYVGGGGLTLNGSGAGVTMTGNTATNAGSSISTASTVNVSGSNVTLGGDIEISTGGVWTNNAGSTVSPTNVILAGGTFNANNSTTNIGGNLTIQSAPVVGGTFNGNSGTFNIAGNFIYSTGPATPAFNAGTSTFNFNGTGAQSISNSAVITFNNLTDSNTTQQLTLNNSLNVNGTLNINGANAVLNPTAATVIGGTGTLTGTGTARVTRIAATPDFFSQYTITNKTLTNLLVDYVGTSAQIISGTTYSRLRLNNASSATLGGNVIVDSTLFLTAGTMNVGTNTLTINNGITVGSGGLASGATGTVNYNQSSDGQSVLAANYGNLTFSNFNKILPNSGTIGVAGTFTPGTATGHTITGSTFNFNGTGAQTIPVFGYNNLTISGARGGANVTLASGTISILGMFTPSAMSVNYITTGNTIDFIGTGAQTVPAFNYNNLTVSGSRGGANVTFANGGTVGVAGVFNPSATNVNYVLTNNTFDYNGTGAQTVPSFNYNNLTVSGNRGGNTVTFTGTIGIAGIFNPSATNIVYSVAGTTFIFNGTSAQTLPSTFTTYNNLTLNNPAGVTGFAGLTVQGLLRIQQGTFTSSSIYNNVQIDSGATLAGTNATTINVGGNWTNNGTFTANGNTVNFNGSSAQTIGGTSATVFNNLTTNNAAGVNLTTNATVGGTLTLTAGTFAIGNNTLTLNGAVTATAGSLNSGIGGTVNYNQSGNGQSVLAANYGNLTFSNFNKVLPNGTIGVAGVFTPGTATGHTITGNTFDFNGSGAQTVPAFSYNNLTISGNRGGTTVTLATGTINVAGSFNPTASSVVYSVAGNTFVFNGGAAQTIPAFTFNNLTTGGAGTKTLGGAVTLLGNLLIGSGTTLDVSSVGNFALNVGGNWTNNGTFNAQNGIVTLNGPAPQTIGGAAMTTFSGLTINNSTGITLNLDTSVNGALSFQNGNITTGANTLIVGTTGTNGSANGFVIGNVQKNFGSAGSFIFPVGTANGYSPATINVVSGAGGLTVSATQSFLPEVDQTNSIQRFWSISSNGITQADITFQYLDADVPMTASETSFSFIRRTGGMNTNFMPSASNTTTNTFTLNGVTQFSDWTLGNLAPTAANVSVSGRVLEENSRGVAKAIITITDQTGNRRTTLSSSFGYFRFDDVEVGQTYIVEVKAKNRTFAPQVIAVNDEITDLIFIASP